MDIGGCADGSGNWYPLLTDTGFEPVCPSDPRFEYVKWLHESGEYRRQLHERLGGKPDCDGFYGLPTQVFTLGAMPAIQLCPECSYHTDGGCVWCPEVGSDAIPECFECNGHHKRPDPWYKNPDFVVPIAATVIATVVSAMLLKRLRLG